MNSVIPEPIRSFPKVLSSLILVTILGTIGYRLSEGLGWIDSLYMTVVTLGTVGFEEVGGPHNQVTKILTIALIMSGAGILAYTVKSFIEIMVDDSTRLYVRYQLTKRELSHYDGHYIVCGLGRVGMSVAQELKESGVEFVVVDNAPAMLEQGIQYGFMMLEGDATDEMVLKEAGLERATGLLACVDSDASNLLLIMGAKSLNPEIKVSARVMNEQNIEKFKRVGADHIYSPYFLLSQRIVRSVTQPRVTEIMDLAMEENNYDISVQEVLVGDDSDLVGKSLLESQIRSDYGGMVISMIRDKGGDMPKITHNPPASMKIEAGDILIVVGEVAKLSELKKI